MWDLNCGMEFKMSCGNYVVWSLELDRMQSGVSEKDGIDCKRGWKFKLKIEKLSRGDDSNGTNRNIRNVCKSR